MKYGVIYKFKTHKKLNGTLFYCYEYCQFLRNWVDAKLYLVGISPDDLRLVETLFAQKYNHPINNIVPVERVTDVYKLKLDKTVILDVDTFYGFKEFLTNDIFCYSNDTHPMFRYANDRRVTYFGSYDYQPRDVFSYLKLGMSMFKTCGSQRGVFISSMNSDYIAKNMNSWRRSFDCPIILKKPQDGVGNLFDYIDSVHYVHTSRDKNNRIIPEAFFHNKQVTIERPYPLDTDSVQLRFDDITSNGLANYMLDETDQLITSCLKS